MDKYSRYYGIITFVIIVLLSVFVGYKLLQTPINNLQTSRSDVAQKEQELSQKQQEKRNVENKLRQIKDSISATQKKIYSPIDTDLGNEALFFTLYSDLIEMIHSNSVKIKAMDYSYNPEGDAFVQFGNAVYFVCEIKMELVSNYVNLGKLIQDIYQYPYYIKIDHIDITPYEKDKKILVSNVRLKLYAHTSPVKEDNVGAQESDDSEDDEE